MHMIAFVVSPDFQVLGLSALTVFEVANKVLGQQAYAIELLSEHGGAVPSSAGFAVQTQAFGAADYDTVLFGTGLQVVPSTPGTLAFVRRAMDSARRVAAPCIGAFILAEAGVLDGRRATTHWAWARTLQQRFPRLKVDDDRIFITDGPVWTSAGMSASIDLALAMVEQDLGPAVTREAARNLVLYHRRGGGQSQFSALLEIDPRSDRIRKAVDYARQHLRQPLSVEQLADVANLSPRQFSRAFRAETGQSPAKAVEHLRVEAARTLMEQGRLAMDTIAAETGFSDRERMRRAFLRAYGQPPQMVRRNARQR
ncbi:MAG TPA: GlxA family transcriptional regulator [Burkholderiaceae bacterium]|nr:GlxA family transcriptional regulator [Burkholderiaceae bacterium]